MADIHAPKNISVVLLLRLVSGGKFELFMVRHRRDASSRQPTIGFPGGDLRKEDFHEAMLKRCWGLGPIEARRILGSELTPKFSMGYWVAGVRILYEEIGILLCTTVKGVPPDMNHRPLSHSLKEKRRLLIEGVIDLRTILEAEELLCDVGGLAYFSHWSSENATPGQGARYFLAHLPSHQNTLLTSHPKVDGLWMTPERALDLCEQGQFESTFPTFASIRTLADFDSWESVWAEYRYQKGSKPV